jgi:AcrR family transcriptional regulator
MARPKSEDRRLAIFDAAIRVIATQGLGAPTAKIAKEAGIPNGSLFTYFETKSELLNQLYLELKTEVIDAATHDLPAGKDFRQRMFRLWTNWLGWAVVNPQKRRVMEQLNVSDQITPATRAEANRKAALLNEMVEQMRAHGSLKGASLGFTGGLVTAVIDATIMAMMADPAEAEKNCGIGFEAFWRVIS